MVVIVIIGLLATIGLANFLSMQEKARYGACIKQQRTVFEAAILYGSENLLGTEVVNVDVLWGAGILTEEVGECPSSGTVDWDDYRVNFVNDDPTAIICSIRAVDHLFTP